MLRILNYPKKERTKNRVKDFYDWIANLKKEALTPLSSPAEEFIESINKEGND